MRVLVTGASGFVGNRLAPALRDAGHDVVAFVRDPVPALAPRLSAYWLALVTDVPLSVARPLVEGLENPITTDDDRLPALCGVTPTPFADAVRRALAADAG